jgi:hypothetical protein
VERPLDGASLDEKLERITEMLRAIADEEPEMRRRVRGLRESPAYREAYETPDPLVSIVIPTYRNFEALRDVSLPSILGQTYSNLEVVVVGDAAPPETAEVIREIGDDRIRFENLPLRGPYPSDPDRAWMIAGTPPFNAAVAIATGRWIAPLGDDDAFAPDHVERLLGAALARRLELVYASLRAHLPDGTEKIVGEFPPRLTEFGLQGALYHSGLSFMEQTLSDEVFDVPNDWSLCRRMMRAGVRIGMVDAVTVDYFPSSWGRRDSQAKEPPPDPELEAATARLVGAERELSALRSRADELERRLAAISSSKTWRATEPLRSLARRARGRGAP